MCDSTPASVNNPLAVHCKRSACGSQVVFKLLIKLTRRADKVVFGRRSLPKRVRQSLAEPPGFDRNDVKFVEVAYATKSDIISEDRGPRDFDERIAAILQNNFAIEVLSLDSAINKISNLS